MDWNPAYLMFLVPIANAAIIGGMLKYANHDRSKLPLLAGAAMLSALLYLALLYILGGPLPLPDAGKAAKAGSDLASTALPLTAAVLSNGIITAVTYPVIMPRGISKSDFFVR
jgi:hypothetical protein